MFWKLSMGMIFFLGLMCVNLRPSQEPDQWAHFLRVGPSHSRKPSIEDKQYYASLIMDSNKLLQDLAKIFFNVDFLSGPSKNLTHDDLYQLLTLCNQAKSILTQLANIGKELRLYAAQTSDEAMSKHCEVITKTVQSYQRRLDVLDAGALKGLREIKLKDVQGKTPQMHGVSVQIPLCIVDEMKTAPRTSKSASVKIHRPRIHARNLPQPTVEIDTQGSSLGCRAKTCIVGITSTIVAGIVLVILLANGYFGHSS